MLPLVKACIAFLNLFVQSVLKAEVCKSMTVARCQLAQVPFTAALRSIMLDALNAPGRKQEKLLVLTCPGLSCIW